MSVPPTPQQRRALDSLAYLAPLLRQMRCEVARVVWSVGTGRERSAASMLLGPGNAPPGVRREMADATLTLLNDWLTDPQDEAAVNFDTHTGLVDLHRHGDHTYPNAAKTFWISGMASTGPSKFAQPLAPLLTGTLSTGGAAVLADWFDEQRGDWEPLTTALRTWGSFTPTAGEHTNGFHYALLSPDAALWQFRVWDDWTAVDGESEEWVVGLGVFGPEGLERAWHFSRPKPLDPAFSRQFWKLFPAASRETE